MKLELRYLVLKIKDVEKYLTKTEKAMLYILCQKIQSARLDDNKSILEGIVIQKDWPEYEPTLELLSKRVDNE